MARASHTLSASREQSVRLDSVIADVFEARAASLANIKLRLRQIADIHETECEKFARDMHLLAEQSQQVSCTSEATERELEIALAKEQAERARAVEIVATFKRDGSKVIAGLRATLLDVRAQLEAEIARNRVLSQKSECNAPEKEKLSKLLMLLDQQDSIIAELHRDKQQLDAKVQELTFQRDQLLDADSVDDVLPPLLSKFRRSEQGETTMTHTDMCILTRALIKKLKAEQIARLRVEEQAAKIAAAQEHSLRQLETRIKTLPKARPSPSVPVESSSPPLTLPQLTAVAPRDTSRSHAHVPSLEEQLSSVSAEFHASLKQWQSALDDTDFFPE